MGEAHNNWLATLGNWISVPVKALLRPWWEKLVEQKAASVAIRSQSLRGLVLFRIKDFQRALHKEDPDRVLGIANSVLGRITVEGSCPEIGPFPSTELIRQVEREIMLSAIDLTIWAQLACLHSIGEFDPRHFVMVEFTEEDARRTSFTQIASLESRFPFATVIAVSETNAAVSDAGVGLLRDFCARREFPSVVFAISAETPSSPLWGEFRDKRTLPKGWVPEFRGQSK